MSSSAPMFPPFPHLSPPLPMGLGGEPERGWSSLSTSILSSSSECSSYPLSRPLSVYSDGPSDCHYYTAAHHPYPQPSRPTAVPAGYTREDRSTFRLGSSPAQRGRLATVHSGAVHHLNVFRKYSIHSIAFSSTYALQ